MIEFRCHVRMLYIEGFRVMHQNTKTLSRTTDVTKTAIGKIVLVDLKKLQTESSKS